MTGIDLLRASMTPAERAHGRFMRAPDGHDGGDGGGSGAADEGAGGEGDQAGSDGQGAEAGGGQDEAGEGGQSLMTGSDKADEGQGGESGKGEGDGNVAQGPPEKYEITPPEGFTLDEAVMAEVDPVFRELGLDNEGANKVVALAKPFADRLFAAQNDAFQEQATGWAKAAKEDKEIGGKNWAETETLVAKALDTFGAPKEFRELLDNTKLGNHPDMIRMFRKIGAQLGEGGSLARPDAAAPVKQDRTAVLYPNDLPKEVTA